MDIQQTKIVYDEIFWFSKKRKHHLPFEPITAFRHLFEIMPYEIIKIDYIENVSITIAFLQAEFSQYQMAYSKGERYNPSEKFKKVEHIVHGIIKSPNSGIDRQFEKIKMQNT
jgi:hypothetical protein